MRVCKILSKHKMKSHPQLTILCFVTVILFLLHQMNHVWQRCCYPRDNKFLQVLRKRTAKKRRDLLTPPLEKECGRNTTLEYQKTQMRLFQAPKFWDKMQSVLEFYYILENSLLRIGWFFFLIFNFF